MRLGDCLPGIQNMLIRRKVKDRGPGVGDVAADLADQGFGRREAALVPELLQRSGD